MRFAGGDNLTGFKKLVHDVFMKNELKNGEGAYEIYNTPQKLDRGIRCMLACHNREGGMARCVTCGEDMMLLLRPRSPWKL